MRFKIRFTLLLIALTSQAVLADMDDLSGINKDEVIRQIQYMKNYDFPDELIDSLEMPLKCGTRYGQMLIQLKDEIEPVLFKQLLERPVRHEYFDSDHFRIHYDTSGQHAPPLDDTNPANGIPDYVDSMSLVLEYVWSFEIDTLGFIEPVSDGGEGGDLHYDVYLSDIGGMGYYGVTYPETIQPDGRTWSSYIEQENDYANTIFVPMGYDVNPMAAVKVTSAHEFFHAIHFSIDAYEFSGGRFWWYEVSAVWMEDVVFDEVNDYLYYLKYFFHYPWLSLETFTTSISDIPRFMHPYAACVWGRFLEERFDRDVMRQIWEICGSIPGYNVLPATDLVLNDYGSSFKDAFMEFTSWNYFTANRADTVNKYSEADLWINPLSGIPDTVKTRYFTNRSPEDYMNVPDDPAINPIDTSFSSEDFTPEPLSANYLVFTTYGAYNQFLGGLWFDFDGDNITAPQDYWQAAILGYANDRDTLMTLNINPSDGQGAGSLRDWSRYDSLVVIPSIFGYTFSSYSTGYSFQAYYDENLRGDSPIFYNIPDSVQIRVGKCKDNILLQANHPFGDSVFFYAEPTSDSVAIVHTSDTTAELTYCAYSDSIGEVVSLKIYASDTAGHYDARQIKLYIISAIQKSSVVAYPNPFNYDESSNSILRFIRPFPTNYSDIEIYIFNINGDLVKKLEYSGDEGEQTLTWDVRNAAGNRLAGGIYIIKLRAGGKTASGKFAVIR